MTGQPSHYLTGDQMASRISTPESRRRWANETFNKFMGLELVEQQDGYSRILMRPNEHSPRGAGGGVHGGILSSLIDVGALASIATVVGPSDIMAGTAELNISYLRPAVGDLVVTESRVLRKGRTLILVDIDISDGHGRLFCKGRVHYAIKQRGA